MNAGDDEHAALIPAPSTTLVKTGVNSLAARGHDLLHKQGEAAEWLRKGLELQKAAPESLAPELQTTLEYTKQILDGNSAELAAKNLGMTPEEQEFAHTANLFLGDTLKECSHLEATRENQLREAFQCFKAGHELDPWNPELLYWLAESYWQGGGGLENREKALALYQRAAGMGCAEAQAEVASWYQAAAEQGDHEAVCLIAEMRQRGWEVKHDHAEAARLLGNVVAGSDETAMHNLQLLRQAIWGT